MTVTPGELLELVQGRVDRFTDTSDRRDLCDAAGLRDAAALLEAVGPLRHRRLRRPARAAVGLLRYARHLVQPAEEDRRAADELLPAAGEAEIAAVRRAAERPPQPGPELPPVEHLVMATYGASLALLGALVARIRHSLSDHPTADDLRYLVIAADALEGRWARTGAVEDLQDAIDTMTEVVDRTSPDDEWYPGRKSRIGGLLQFRFTLTGRQQDLDDGILAIRIAREAVAPGHQDWSMFHANLGRALLFRYSVTKREADLDEAVSMLSEAVSSTSDDDPLSNAASRLGLLQQATMARYLLRGDADDLADALNMAMQAWEATPEGDHNLIERALDLSRAHLAVFQHTGAAEHAAAAKRMAQQIVRVTPREQLEHQMAAAILWELRNQGA
ncbi:hypothetical protein HII36_41225 [Nonomuraea sp. NN258]|uniref:hypothetical protein n=1 Tax=Nonomuraea antri TaxID=2730852 RepID=UPI001569C2AD|nr:hypothetical protein [Nonomuraea antri]NRQ38209.1 hypothetical protein [Nonomuraea antri]